MSDLRETLRKEFLENDEYANSYWNDFLNVYIATQLKVLREQRGFDTQTDFARASGISQEQISQLESIDRNSWTVNTLRKFAKSLGVVVKVSFESFSDGIEDIVNFRRESLQRLERTEDLGRFLPHAMNDEVHETQAQTEGPETRGELAQSKISDADQRSGVERAAQASEATAPYALGRLFPATDLDGMPNHLLAAGQQYNRHPDSAGARTWN